MVAIPVENPPGNHNHPSEDAGRFFKRGTPPRKCIPLSPEQSAELMFCFLFWRHSNTPQHARHLPQKVRMTPPFHTGEEAVAYVYCEIPVRLGLGAYRSKSERFL